MKTFKMVSLRPYYPNIGLVLLAVIAFSLMVYYKTHGLQDIDSLDYAQIARNIYEGKGYTTDYVLPLAVKHTPNGETNPNLWRAPLYPTFLALVFLFTGPCDEAVIFVSGVFYILLVLLIYEIGKRLYSWQVGFISGLMVLCIPEFMNYATSGLTETPYTCLFVMTLYLVHRKSSPWVIGVLSGLCYLTRYIFTLCLAVLALHLVFSLHREKKPWLVYMIKLGLTFVITISPWCIRNTIITGEPLFTLQKYETQIFTEKYPLYTIYHRLDTQPTGSFIKEHGSQIIDKALNYSLLTYWPHALHLPPVPGVDTSRFFYPKEFIDTHIKEQKKYKPDLFRFDYYHKWSLPVIFFLALYFISIWGSSTKEKQPLLGVTGIMFLFQWIVQLFIHPVARHYLPFFPFAILIMAAYWSRKIKIWWEIALLVSALGVFIMFHAPCDDPKITIFCNEEAANLERMTPEGSLILTDSPGLVSWKAHRRAIWIPCRTEDFLKIEAKLGRIEYLYIFSLNAPLFTHFDEDFKRFLDRSFYLIQTNENPPWKTFLSRRKAN